MLTHKYIFFLVLSIFGFLLCWEFIVILYKIPEYLIPSPTMIIIELIKARSYIFSHIGTTALEIVFGFVPGALIAFILGALITESRIAESIITLPLLTSQVIPKIALAPLLIIWFGYGISPKAIITALIAFFPILSNTILGIRSVNREYLELMHTFDSTRIQTFFKVKLPFTLPYILSAAKVSILYSVVGAITAEFVGSSSGIGFIISQSQDNLNVSLMFAGLLVASLLGAVLWALMLLIEKFYEKKYRCKVGGLFKDDCI